MNKDTDDIIKNEKAALRNSMEALIMFICNQNNGLIYFEENWEFWIIRADGKMICSNDTLDVGSDGQKVVYNKTMDFFEGTMSNLTWILLPSIIKGNDTPAKIKKNNDYAITLLKQVNGFDLVAWAEEGKTKQFAKIQASISKGS